jgi:hypothetical protein
VVGLGMGAFFVSSSQGKRRLSYLMVPS